MFIGLLIISPILLMIILLIFLSDYHSPFYVANRVGKDGKIFKNDKNSFHDN